MDQATEMLAQDGDGSSVIRDERICRARGEMRFHHSCRMWFSFEVNVEKKNEERTPPRRG
jgi:hypothetical protein